MPKAIIFTASSGFSNRMLPTVSLYTWCKANNVPLYIVWKDKTHRACINRDENGVRFGMRQYFQELPGLIKTVDHIQQIGIPLQMMYHHGMNWQKSFPLELLQHDYLHLFDCCFLISLFPEYQDVVGDRSALSKELIDNYTSHPYIKMVTSAFQDFKFAQTIVDEATKLVGDGIGNVAIQLRNTDGGFTVNNTQAVVDNVYEIIRKESENAKVHFMTENPVNHDDIVSKFPQVIVYGNRAKFQNNDIGSFYSLVDWYVLSMCEKVYVSSISSFALLAFLYNQRDDKEMVYHCY